MLKNYFRSKLTGTSLLHYLGWPTWGHPLTGATPPTTASAGGGEKGGIINQTGDTFFFIIILMPFMVEGAAWGF